jgi:hypothetical protein
MLKFHFLFIAVLTFSLTVSAKKKEGPPDPAWAGITARGRVLAEYHSAARQATDALYTAKPEPGSVTIYIAKKTDAGWVVAFGRFNDPHDRFIVAYQATQGLSPDAFTIAQNILPQEDAGFFYMAAKAVETSERDFHGENRRYDIAVLPAEPNQMYVYVYPAQSTKGAFLYGGDVRYLVSSDGSAIVERRQMHKTILEYRANLGPGKTVVGGVHSHILSDVPEDSDVFYVLVRKPQCPETIGAGKHVYQVQVDGTIKRLQ